MTRGAGLHVIVYATVLSLALLCIPFPFWGDQALFTIGAEMMRDGAVLYVDFWDLVQPGIFVFYLLAGSAFGFTEVGIHAFELIYLLLMGVVIYRTQRSRFTHAWVAALLPLFTVGLYYAVSGWWELTQREGLALFPLYLSYWWASRAVDAEPATGVRRLFLAGFCGAVAAAFKHMFAVIPGAFVATALIYICLQRRPGWARRCAIGAGSAAAGLTVGLALCFGYFFWTAGVDHLLWTFVELPQRISSELDVRQRTVLVAAVRWFGGRFTGVLVLACIGWCDQWRRHADVFTMNLLVWVCVGAGLWAVQLWWQYLLMIVVVPLGLLAAYAVDGAWSVIVSMSQARPPKRAALALGAVVMCAIFPLIPENGLRALYLARTIVTADSLDEGIGRYQETMIPTYAPARQELLVLERPDALPGPIYVFGDPVYHFLSGRPPAIAQNGWSLEAWIPEMWEHAIHELGSTLPPYIIFTEGYEFWIEQRPELGGLLSRHYRLEAEFPKSLWYVRRDDSAARND